MRLTERFVPILVRAMAGLIAAALGALAGMVLAGISLPPGTDRPTLLVSRIFLIGLGASTAAWLPWWRPGHTAMKGLGTFLLIATGALAGAVIGLAFAEVFQEQYDPLRRVQQISRTMVYGASIGANVLPALTDIRGAIAGLRRQALPRASNR